MKKIFLLFVLTAVLFSCEEGNDISPNSFSGAGTGGSLASFLVAGNNLYVLAGNQLKTFNLEERDTLRQTSTIYINSNLETLFHYQDQLFVGSNDAVHFLDLDNPNDPEYLSSWRHMNSCDPVVAMNGIAYSTIRVTDCTGNQVTVTDQLDVIDVSDINEPKLIESQVLDTPYGLGVNAEFLFVCEKGGISVFDNVDPRHPKFLWNENQFIGRPIDLILQGDYMLLVTSEDVFNVAIDEEGHLKVLAKITQ